jgi:hypothetical protein
VKRQKAVLLAEHHQTRGRAGQDAKIGAAENFGTPRSRILPLRNPSNCRHELRHKFVISRKTSSNNHFLVALEISTKTVDNLVENTGTAGSRLADLGDRKCLHKI